MGNKMIRVVGDIMLDEWLNGNLEKKSAEAPINIFERKIENYSLGGVGNLSINLKSLGIKFDLFSEIGKDNYGKKVLKILREKKIKFNILKIKKQTSIKRRFFKNNKQVFREDIEDTTINKRIGDKVYKKLKSNEILVISDYNKGSIHKNFLNEISKKNIVTFVDPKNKPFFYKKAFLVKPNMEKFEEWCGKYSKKKAFQLLKQMKWKWLIISNNKKGVHVFNHKDQYNFYKVKKVKNPNVIGAGDIFFAGIIYNYLKGLDIFTSVEMSSHAASKCVAKKKIRKISKKDFIKDVVFTNGVYDLLHKGHLDLLKFSKKIGKYLVVGINSDKSVKLLKGKNRPYNNINLRIKKLKQTKLIDKIFKFSEKSPLKLIKIIKPDVIVKGDDYDFNQVKGSQVSNIILFKRKKKISSTQIISKLNKTI